MPDPYILLLLGLGWLVLLAAWLPRVVRPLPLSVPIICTLLGMALFSLPDVDTRVDPLQAPEVTERFAEIVVIIALMGAGLKLDRPFGWQRWTVTWRLLGIVMPLSIGGIALVGWWGLGLPMATAALLAASLAPTDPVLASDVQVGPPRSGEEDEVRFGLTSEAGLNDGLAFPFVNLAIALAAVTATGAPLAGELWSWAWHDVAWKLLAGALGGWLVGKALGWVTFHLPGHKLSTTGDGLVAVGAVLVSYALTEVIHGYGFVAVFVTAVTLRAAQPDHDYHEVLHDFVEQVERLMMMIVLVLFGGALASGLLGSLGWREVAAALVILLVVRPLATVVGMLGSGRPWLEQGLLGFFGIRGIGTIYYVAHGLNEASFAEAERLWAIVALIILLSVLTHGALSTPLMRLLDRRSEHDGPPSRPALAASEDRS